MTDVDVPENVNEKYESHRTIARWLQEAEPEDLTKERLETVGNSFEELVQLVEIQHHSREQLKTIIDKLEERVELQETQINQLQGGRR